MSDDVADVVFVPVVEITTGREIGWNTNVSELLRSLWGAKTALAASDLPLPEAAGGSTGREAGLRSMRGTR